jgi:hypothetical protein
VTPTEPRTVLGVLAWVASNPWTSVGQRWNYKSAVLSSLCRALIFFATNLSAGGEAALAAMTAEFCLRFSTAGFYGALTQAFRGVHPPRHGTLAAIVLLPFVAHSLELLVHWWRATPELLASVGVSVAFTMLSTWFNLFAMRRGVLVVGAGGRSLWEDLRAMPRLVAAFVACRGA